MRAHSGLRPPSFTEPKRSNTLRRVGDEIVREGEPETTDLRFDVDEEETRAPNAAEPEDEEEARAPNATEPVDKDEEEARVPNATEPEDDDATDIDGYRMRVEEDGDDGER